MKNGLYSVRISTPGRVTGGVVFLQDGHLRGGDAGSYFVGSYTVLDKRLIASVQVKTHYDSPDLVFLMGRAGGTIELTGTASDTTAVLKGISPQAPDVTFMCRLEWLAD